MVLPNGRIYGRGRLEEMGGRKGFGMMMMMMKGPQAAGIGGSGGGDTAMFAGDDTVRDPTTGEVFRWDEVRKVFIT